MTNEEKRILGILKKPTTLPAAALPLLEKFSESEYIKI